MPIPHRIRTITNWLPYSDITRNKQMWHINKSNSNNMILQFKSFLTISIRKELEVKKWSVAKEILKREMSIQGTAAPRISDSRIGTLKSDIYQMGLIKYEKEYFKITDAGHEFLKNDKSTLFFQFVKMQFSNPTILDYCKDIYVFPIVGIIKLLLDKSINYLTKEELGYIVFLNYLYEDSFDDVKEKILVFRNYAPKKQSEIINSFKNTPEGHVTLKKASTATYLMSRLKASDYFVDEKENNIKVLKLNYFYIDQIKNVLDFFYGISPYPYSQKDGIDYDVWFEYIGTAGIISPPQLKELIFINSTNDMIINIIRENKVVSTHSIPINTTLTYPFFNGANYVIDIFNPILSETMKFEVIPKKDEDIYIDLNEMDQVILNSEFYIQKTEELIRSRDYDQELLNRIKHIECKFNRNNFNVSSIRGARLEELIYKIMSYKKSDLHIQELIWKGSIDEYGIPHQTPGGTLGNPDLVVVMEDNIVLIELTTSASKSGQEKSESLNIARHARNFKENNKELFEKFGINHSNLRLIFSAPIIHKDFVQSMSKILDHEQLSYNFISIDNLLDNIRKNHII